MTQRILFFGMEGVFSRAPLLELINAHHHICAIIVPRPEQSQAANVPIRLIPPTPLFKGGLRGDSALPLMQEPRDPNIIGIAWNAGIDVYEVATLRNDATIQTIQRFQPDLIVVACFPLLLPNHLITQYPSLNLHPSLLPAYRGPSPLFWIFHDGLEHAGVTIHLMDEHADTGDIVAQERVALPDGIRYADADKILSEHAAGLLIKILGQAPNGQFASTPQPRTPAPFAPNPSEQDYVITTDWSVRRAFNFVRGIAEWNHPITFQLEGKRLVVREAIAYDEREEMSVPFLQTSAGWKIRSARGTITLAASETTA